MMTEQQSNNRHDDDVDLTDRTDDVMKIPDEMLNLKSSHPCHLAKEHLRTENPEKEKTFSENVTLSGKSHASQNSFPPSRDSRWNRAGSNPAHSSLVHGSLVAGRRSSSHVDEQLPSHRPREQRADDESTRSTPVRGESTPNHVTGHHLWSRSRTTSRGGLDEPTCSKPATHANWRIEVAAPQNNPPFQ